MTTLSLNAADIRDILAIDRKLRSLPGAYQIETYSSIDSPEKIIINGVLAEQGLDLFPRYFLSRNFAPDNGFMIWTWNEAHAFNVNICETFPATRFYDALLRLVEMNTGINIR